jgi:hypothetical protein
VKNNEEEPKEYFERHILFVVSITTIGLFINWLSFQFLIEVNPWGSLTAVPGFIILLQAILLIVNPYAIVYEDRFEIKQSLLYNKEFYYLDIKAIDQTKNNSITLIYNDGDTETIPLLGMRASHKQNFKNKLAEKIAESIKHRDF